MNATCKGMSKHVIVWCGFVEYVVVCMYLEDCEAHACVLLMCGMLCDNG